MFLRTCRVATTTAARGVRWLSSTVAVQQRVVMVTGGAKGIGLGVTKAFADEGDIVVALYVVLFN